MILPPARPMPKPKPHFVIRLEWCCNKKERRGKTKRKRANNAKFRDVMPLVQRERGAVPACHAMSGARHVRDSLTNAPDVGAPKVGPRCICLLVCLLIHAHLQVRGGHCRGE